MFNYKSIFALGTMLLLPFSVFADTCATLPKCADLGFVNTASECGSLKKLKCPFGDAYFCSTNNCKSVSVNSNSEICTKKCDEDANVCVEKRAMTCSEYLNKNCDRQYSDGATMSGDVTGKVCVKGTVTGTATFTQTTIYDVKRMYSSCATELSDKTVKLNLSYLTIKSYATFYIDTTISHVEYNPSNGWSANFFGNTDVTAYYNAEGNWIGTLGMTFGTYNTDELFTSNVVVYCQGGSNDQWNPAKCSVGIGSNGSNTVTVCGRYGSNSYGNCSFQSCYNTLDITCNGQYNPSNGCSFDSMCARPEPS